MALNNICISGRLVRDPELRHTNNGKAVSSFTIAVDRDFDRNTADFVDIVAWGNTADFVAKYFAKGRTAIVTGSLQFRDWTDKNGNKRRNAEVIADHVYFGDSPKAADTAAAPQFEQFDNDEDIPF